MKELEIKLMVVITETMPRGEDGKIQDRLLHSDLIVAVTEALRIYDVSRRSELLFAFIAEIKSEFADQNWDYLDFIAERVIGKQ